MSRSCSYCDRVLDAIALAELAWSCISEICCFKIVMRLNCDCLRRKVSSCCCMPSSCASISDLVAPTRATFDCRRSAFRSYSSTLSALASALFAFFCSTSKTSLSSSMISVASASFSLVVSSNFNCSCACSSYFRNVVNSD